MQDVEQLTNKANEYYQAGRYAQAEKLYRKLLNLDEKDFQSLLMVGLCRQQQQDNDGALQYLERAVAAGDNQAELHFQLGRHYLEMQRVEQGRESLAQAIALNPNHVAARTMLGYSFISTREYERAISELKIARRADARFAPATIMLSLALLEAGQLEEAAREANLAVQLAPDNPGAHSVLGNVLLAQGHAHFAEQCFRRVLEKHPQNLELRAGLGRALAATGQWAEAARVLEGVLNGGLRTPEIGITYARALAGQGRLDQAQALLERIPDPARDASYQVLLADIRIGRGDGAGAHEAIDALPEDHPEKALLGARLHRAEGDTDKAVELLRPLFEHEDAAIARRARLLCADARFAGGNSESAYEVIEPLLTSERPDRRAVELWTGFLSRERRWEALVAFLEPVLEKIDLGEGDRARANGLLVAALDACGRMDPAAELLEAAAWREPDFLRAYSSESGRQAREALVNAPDDFWSGFEASAETDGESPVFVFGWAGSGQRELIATLSGSADVRVLPNENLDERADIYRELSVPGQPPMSDDSLARIRAECLAAEAGGAGRALDRANYETALLPGIARLFPGATVIVVSAQEADLHLHWMMNGYKRPLDILDAYRRERELFTHLQDKLPLNFIVVPRHRLLAEPGAVLESLYGQLGLAWEDGVEKTFQAHATARQLRPDGHWKHYAEVLGRD